VGTNGYSPEEIMFGFKSNRPDSPLYVHTPAMTEDEYLPIVQANLRKIYEEVRIARQKAKQANEAFRNANSKERKFQTGQLVYCLSKIIGGPSGLICRKRGPYVITDISAHGQTADLREISTGRNVKRHFAHMLPAQETHMSPRLNSNWDEELRHITRDINV